MTLIQILTHHQTIFSLVMYCIGVILLTSFFTVIHDRLDNQYLQFAWDKIGTPLLQTFLIIAFILLVYPLNFGVEEAPKIKILLNVDEKRFDYLINIIFLLTVFFPLMPIINKWDELIIPLQGVIASMIIFGWLCNAIQLSEYRLFPDFNTFLLLVLSSIITHRIADYLSHHLGGYLDNFFEREGFNLLIFRCVVLIMQCPIIFIFGISIGKQIDIS